MSRSRFWVGLILAISVGQASACSLLDRRICEFDARIKVATGGHAVQYVSDFTARVAEYEWTLGQPDIIHLGDTLSLGDDELYFAIAHEVGHSQLRHGRKFVESLAPVTAHALSDSDLVAQYGKMAQATVGSEELNHGQEYEADAFAAKILHAEGLDYAKAMSRLLQTVGGSSTHPHKRSRIANAKAAIASLEKT